MDTPKTLFEMTGSYGLVLPLVIANMSAYGLAKHFRPVPIYDALLEQDGIHLPHPSRAIRHAIERLRISEVMTPGAVDLPAGDTVSQALEITGKHDFSTYPVVENGVSLVGMVSEVRLRRTLSEGGGNRILREISERGDHVYPDQPLVRAVVHMDQSKVRQLPVLERGADRRIVGFLTMSDIVSAQAPAALDAGEEEKTVAPNFSEAK